jgi:hypothetical protein
MTKKEIVEILDIPCKEIHELLSINRKALIALVIANTDWLKYDKPYFNFKIEGKKLEQPLTKNDLFSIYNNFLDSFTHFNEHVMKNNKDFKKGWRNRQSFKEFILGLKHAKIIDEEIVSKCFDVLHEYSYDEWKKILS